MELHRAIIYTTDMSKQVTKSYVRDAAHMCSVNGGAGLTGTNMSWTRGIKHCFSLNTTSCRYASLRARIVLLHSQQIHAC
jgi:hypothetical protein